MFGTNYTDPSAPSDSCLSTVTSTHGFIFNLLILVFIPVTYVPQYHRVFTRKSTYGISPYFLLFSVVASTSLLGGGMFQLAYSYSNWCCKEDAGVEKGIHCYGAQMGAWQALMQWVCCTGLLVLFYIYARAEQEASIAVPVAETAPSAPNLSPPSQTSWRAAKRISYTGFFYIFINLALFLAYALHQLSKHSAGFLPDDLIFYIFLGGWAILQMTLAFIFLCVQSVPQIITTLRMRQLGSLSIPSMCVQVPGYFIWAAALRVRYPEIVWVPVLVAGAVQDVLLMLSVYLERERWRAKRALRLTSDEDEDDLRQGPQVDDHHDGTDTAASPKSGPISL